MSRHSPAIARLALAYYDLGNSRKHTGRTLGVTIESINRWIARREVEGPDWPTMAEDAAWHATRAQRERNAARERAYRAHRYLTGGGVLVDALGTRRRLRALMALGWTVEDIRLHSVGSRWNDPASVQELLDRTKITPRNRDLVADVYDRLHQVQGPSEINRRRGVRQGWAPPSAWDDIDDPHELPETYIVEDLRTIADDDVDEAVVFRIIAGDVVPATRAEKFAVVHRWCDLGRPLADLERLTGWNVHRYTGRAVAS